MKNNNDRLRQLTGLKRQAEPDAARSKYLDLYDLAHVGYCTISEKGLILEANLTASTLLGVNLSTLKKQTLSRFILKDDQDIHVKFCRQVFETCTTQTCNLRMMKKDKAVFRARFDAIAMKDTNGALVCRLVISDITASRQLEEKLHECENQMVFEKLFSELSARFINLPADQIDAAIEDAQKQICECLHLELSALYQLMPDCPGTLFSTHNYLPTVFPEVPKNMNGKEYFPWCLEKVIKGERIILKRIADAPPEAATDIKTWRRFGVRSALLLPLSTGGGLVFGVLTFDSYQYEMDWTTELVERLQLLAQIFANALARKQSKKELLESETRYKAIFDEAIEGMFRTSPEGKILLANPALAKILGYESAHNLVNEITDLSKQVWVNPDERLRFTRIIEKQGTIKGFECQFLRKDGSVIWVSLNGRAIRGPDGRFSHYDGFLEDITKRKELGDQLQLTLEEVKQLRDRLQMENIYLRDQLKRDDTHLSIVGESKPLLNILAEAKKVAATDSTVLLLGETGTGKELLAQAIHDMSSRKDKLLVIVNCASLPPTLIESELFGREKGAYTGSLTRMTGRFEIADGSTLFLDEIGDLPLELQGKLLRVLEQGQFERLGSSRTIRVNVRLIAATNRDLARDVNEGKFRKDLYYRLNVFPINIPPLRERKEDIPSLVWSFVNKFEKSMGKKIESIPKKCMEVLMSYSWPGNIRQLKNVIEHAMIINNCPTLYVAPPVSAPHEQLPSSSLAETERRHILDVLERTSWRISGNNGAAEILGMKRTTLQSKIKVLGIKRSI